MCLGQSTESSGPAGRQGQGTHLFLSHLGSGVWAANLSAITCRFLVSHCRTQRLAPGSAEAPPQSEGHHGQGHDQEDPHRDGCTVVAPLGAGLWLLTSHQQVWEEEDVGVRMSPVGTETGDKEGAVVPGQGDGIRTGCLVGGEKRNQREKCQTGK